MTNDQSPQILVIAGPNGAGKSTCASMYLPVEMAFLNADEVAKGLPGYPGPAADIHAGRIILGRMDEHESRRESFAVETTLATRSLANRIVRLRRSGYDCHPVYFWAPDPEFSIRRVASRVRAEGITFRRKRFGVVIRRASEISFACIGRSPTPGMSRITRDPRAPRLSPRETSMSSARSTNQ